MERIATLTRSGLGIACYWRLVFAALGVFVVISGVGSIALAQFNETCEWRGTAPFCEGRCEPGELTRTSSRDGSNAREYAGFGATCLSGLKVYCCRLFFPDEADARTAPPPPASAPIGVETRRGGDVIVNPGPLQGTELNKGPIAAPVPPAPPPPVPVSFEGSWSATAENVAYNILMGQTGNTVIGNFVGADGSRGTFSGGLTGRVLRFTWSQMDGARGSGKFTLSDDGQSFAGSYNFGQNPDDVVGTWNGVRR